MDRNPPAFILMKYIEKIYKLKKKHEFSILGIVVHFINKRRRRTIMGYQSEYELEDKLIKK